MAAWQCLIEKDGFMNLSLLVLGAFCLQRVVAPPIQETSLPTGIPSMKPSHQPNSDPSSSPTNGPSSQPSFWPSAQPSWLPSLQPFSDPSGQPSFQPIVLPSAQPIAKPSSKPSWKTNSRPSRQPSKQPSSKPSRQPTDVNGGTLLGNESVPGSVLTPPQIVGLVVGISAFLAMVGLSIRYGQQFFNIVYSLVENGDSNKNEGNGGDDSDNLSSIEI